MNLHVYFYLLGWCYYTLGPVLAIYLELFPHYTNIYLIQTGFLIYSISLLFSFLIGNWVASYVRLMKTSVYIRSSKNNIFAYISLLFFLSIIVNYAQDVQIGYGGPENILLGPLSTIMIVLTFYSVYFMIPASRIHYKAIIKSLLVYASLIVGICLLLAGGRLYVLTALLWIAAYKFDVNKKNSLRILFWVSFGVIIAVVIGQTRLGVSFEPQIFFFALFSEPLLLYYGTNEYFNNYEIQLISFNRDILASLINFVPSFLFPNKAEFYNTLSQQGIVNSNYGGLHITVSMAENFGLLGSLFFSFMVGFFIKRLRIFSGGNLTMLCLYYFCCSYSVFLFNREAFSTQHKVFLVVLLLSILQNRWFRKHV